MASKESRVWCMAPNALSSRPRRTAPSRRPPARPPAPPCPPSLLPPRPHCHGQQQQERQWSQLEQTSREKRHTNASTTATANAASTRVRRQHQQRVSPPPRTARSPPPVGGARASHPLRGDTPAKRGPRQLLLPTQRPASDPASVPAAPRAPICTRRIPPRPQLAPRGERACRSSVLHGRGDALRCHCLACVRPLATYRPPCPHVLGPCAKARRGRASVATMKLFGNSKKKTEASTSSTVQERCGASSRRRGGGHVGL